MNVKRFTARTSRDALAMVRQAFGDDAVVVSTRPCSEGVEVLAMAPESVQQLERISSAATSASAERRAPSRPAEPVSATSRLAQRAAASQPVAEPAAASGAGVDDDVAQLTMSTLSFQDYVRERMLKRREVELQAQAPKASSKSRPSVQPTPVAQAVMARAAAATRREPAPVLSTSGLLDDAMSTLESTAPRRDHQQPVLDELKSMRGLIEQRFGALAFMEKLQRQPRQATLSQKMMDIGFSPQLVRKLVEALPNDGDETAWAAGVLEHNLLTDEANPPLEDQGGVFALIGSTGVGKTTTTAKLAAAFATQHGAGNLGLITLDAYRVAAHEQLRTYGRILGVPVHTAHDRASLEDLLDLLSAKKLVLIDTAGMAQRDTRTRELLEMLSHRSVKRLLVVNAAQQGETLEDVLVSYRAASCKGVILSKIDEAVKLGPALDAMIRHRLTVLGVANGQRVPEDWHRLSAHALVQRAMRASGSPAWKFDAGDVNLVFAGLPAAMHAAG